MNSSSSSSSSSNSKTNTRFCVHTYLTKYVILELKYLSVVMSIFKLNPSAELLFLLRLFEGFLFSFYSSRTRGYHSSDGSMSFLLLFWKSRVEFIIIMSFPTFKFIAIVAVVQLNLMLFDLLDVILPAGFDPQTKSQ